jgi:hypothetical protein
MIQVKFRNTKFKSAHPYDFALKSINLTCLALTSTVLGSLIAAHRAVAVFFPPSTIFKRTSRLQYATLQDKALKVG